MPSRVNSTSPAKCDKSFSQRASESAEAPEEACVNSPIELSLIEVWGCVAGQKEVHRMFLHLSLSCYKEVI